MHHVEGLYKVYIALQSQSRTWQSVEIFISVAEFRQTRDFAGK